jgi:hypothetical protein
LAPKNGKIELNQDALVLSDDMFLNDNVQKDIIEQTEKNKNVKNSSKIDLAKAPIVLPNSNVVNNKKITEKDSFDPFGETNPPKKSNNNFDIFAEKNTAKNLISHDDFNPFGDIDTKPQKNDKKDKNKGVLDDIIGDLEVKNKNEDLTDFGIKSNPNQNQNNTTKPVIDKPKAVDIKIKDIQIQNNYKNTKNDTIKPKDNTINPYEIKNTKVDILKPENIKENINKKDLGGTFVLETKNQDN